MKSLVKRFLFLALIVLGATGVWAQTPTRILDDIPVGWTVTVTVNEVEEVVSVEPYYNGSPLGRAIIPEGAEVVLTPPAPDRPRVKNVELLSPEEIPLTFEAMVDNATVTFTKASTLPNLPIEYSLNGGAWTTYTSAIPLNSGDKVSFRGNNAAYATSSEGEASHFSCSADCYVYGNVMSLIDPIYFATITELTSDFTFCSLFNNNSHIYNHPTKTLELPALTLSYMCYYGMFKGCTNLTTAPDLHATELGNWCYAHMFEGCTSLATAPALPATTMTEACYSHMFYGCTTLTTAPALPATKLYSWCYSGMFSGCTSLTAAPALPADTLKVSCYEFMFSGCTSLTTAPILPADSLVDNCYQYMFDSCTQLNQVTCLATDISAQLCTAYWLNNVAATGTFIKSAAVTWPTNDVSGIPPGWTPTTYDPQPLTFEAKTAAGAKVTFATGLPNLSLEYSLNGSAWTAYTDPISLDNGDKVSFRGNNATYAKRTSTYTYDKSTFYCSEDCYIYGNVMSLVNSTNFANTTILSEELTFSDLFINNSKIYNHGSKPLSLPATTLAPSCYNKMFYGCTSLTEAPELPATTLAYRCYYEMFRNCTQLTTAPVLPATTLAEGCYSSMFYGCTNLETAPTLPATTLATNCYSSMFRECNHLTYPPVLPATTLKHGCYYEMFRGCSNLSSVTCLATDISAFTCTSDWLSGVASSGTFNKAATMTGWTTGASGIPSGWTVGSVLDLSTVTTNTTVTNNTIITGTLAGNYKISIADGATVTLSGVTINGANSVSCWWAGLNCVGDATIILADGTTNTVKGFYENYPGIHVPSGKTLTIQGTGSLTASPFDGGGTNESYGAGIGGGLNIDCGNIIINSGTITATGGQDAAGIGSAKNSSCGTITISGGTVTANGGPYSAGIGSGGANSAFPSCSSSCGTITISGGTVEASGGQYGAGIGSGDGSHSGSSSCDGITISGGEVTATGGQEAAGIGSGKGYGGSSSCEKITISGGTVEARGGNYGAGIGSGRSASCGDITITNAVTSVTATKGSGATNSIGAGNGGTCGTVTVGGVVGAISTSPYTYPVPVPSGAINGKFTINASGDQVYFSQGNLKYINGTWSFHDNQYDMCFTSAGDVSSYYNASGTFDLFGWGTSGYNHGAMAYLPYSTSTTSSDYYAYDDSGSNLYDWNGTADWGYNAISNGGNTENQWRTLKTEEWVYVLSTRTVNGGTGSGKSYTLGQSVNGVLGVVLYPDDYTGSEYSGSDWATFEAAGCVFLPAAGYRKYDASAYDVGSLGYYWSSSRDESYSAYYLYFNSGIVGTVNGGVRYFGYSVRLVKVANLP